MKHLLAFLTTLITWTALNAQCSMCKVTAESSIADGGSGVALGLNTGILYLASFPYLLAGIIIFMWYRRHKRRKLYEALNI